MRLCRTTSAHGASRYASALVLAAGLRRLWTKTNCARAQRSCGRKAPAGRNGRWPTDSTSDLVSTTPTPKKQGRAGGTKILAQPLSQNGRADYVSAHAHAHTSASAHTRARAICRPVEGASGCDGETTDQTRVTFTGQRMAEGRGAPPAASGARFGVRDFTTHKQV